MPTYPQIRAAFEERHADLFAVLRDYDARLAKVQARKTLDMPRIKTVRRYIRGAMTHYTAPELRQFIAHWTECWESLLRNDVRIGAVEAAEMGMVA